MLHELVADHHELIDTQWNVNDIKGKRKKVDNTELIDTQWNVNTYTSDSLVDETSN